MIHHNQCIVQLEQYQDLLKKWKIVKKLAKREGKNESN